MKIYNDSTVGNATVRVREVAIVKSSHAMPDHAVRKVQ